MRHRPARLQRTVAVAVSTALALAVAACSGDGDNPVSAVVDPCDSPGVTASEIKLGLLYSDSGVTAGPFRASRGGFDARLGLANAAGGVHGRTIVYEWRDDASDPTTNLHRSRELVEQEDVFGLLESSTVSSGGAQYLADNGVPVAGLATETAWSQYENMFAFAYLFNDDTSVDTFGRYVQSNGGTRAAVVQSALSQTSQDIAAKMAASLRSVGVELSGQAVIDYDPTFTDLDSLADQIVAAGVDTLVGTLGIDDFAALIAAVRDKGAPLKVALSGENGGPELLQTYGAQLAGMTFFAPYVPFEVESPAIDAYRQAVALYAPQLQSPDQTLALTSYIIADMFVRGLEEAGPCPTRETFIERLRAVDGYDAGGLVGTTDFEEDFGRLKECYAFVRVNEAGDQFEVVDPSFCGSRLPI